MHKVVWVKSFFLYTLAQKREKDGFFKLPVDFARFAT